MADGAEQEDRTEDPTAKRLEQAAERGDVARTPELQSFLILGAFTLALMISGAASGRSLLLGLRGFLDHAGSIPASGTGLGAIGRHALGVWLGAMAWPIGLILLAGLGGSLAGHRPLWTFEPLAPKLNRLSPGAGLARIFGRPALVQFGKALVKTATVGVVVSVILWGERDRLDNFAAMAPEALLGGVLALALKLLGTVLAAHAIVAVADTAYQRFSWARRQRMSKQELKDELKEQDGNPEIKAKIRQIRVARLRKRMMAAVPGATVVIANPTHFAVALKYEAGMAAPVCVAKGIDVLALRIREIAAEHGVPVIENPPLARALHAVVEIDAEIPVEHYRAVAEVIGYVLRLKRRAS